MDKKIIAIIAVILIAILAVGAYFATSGGSSDNVVRIGHLPSDHDTALFVAKEKKMFEDQGLTVELTQFNNGGDLMTAMASGDIDIGYAGITPVMSSISQGVPVKVVSGAQIEGSAIVAGKNSQSMKLILVGNKHNCFLLLFIHIRIRKFQLCFCQFWLLNIQQ